MGAGASLEHEPEGRRYFCHACGRGFVCRAHTPDECIICGSSFIEEVERTPGQHPLNEDQARRLTNAAALLHLLELQLRDELSVLRSTLANAESQEKAPTLTQIMKDRLRTTNMNVEMMCEQPSCPICSEDYVVAESVIRLPCTHVYHQNCVMPWLESKKTCPICRYELKNEMPPKEEIDLFTSEELKFRIHEHIEIEDAVMEHETRQELAKRYTDILQSEHDHIQQEIDRERERERELAQEGQIDQENGDDGALLQHRFRMFLEQQRQQQLSQQTIAPSLLSDPRSTLRSYRDVLNPQSFPGNHYPRSVGSGIGYRHHHEDSDSDDSESDVADSQAADDYQRIEGQGVSGTIRGYRVITNPMRISNLSHIPLERRMLQTRSMSSGQETSGRGIRVIQYPTRIIHHRSETNGTSPQPVSYIIRHVDSSSGSGSQGQGEYIPVPIRPVAYSSRIFSDDSDDGM